MLKQEIKSSATRCITCKKDSPSGSTTPILYLFIKTNVINLVISKKTTYIKLFDTCYFLALTLLW